MWTKRLFKIFVGRERLVVSADESQREISEDPIEIREIVVALCF